MRDWVGRKVRRILGWGTARGHRAVCAAATQLRGRVDLGWEILPPRPRNGVATHGHDGGAAASEGGDNDVALQAQRKRPRTSSIREVELVRKHLLACAFPGVQDNTPVPKLKGLLFLTSRVSNDAGASHELLQEQYCGVASDATGLPGAGALEGERRARPSVGARGWTGSCGRGHTTTTCNYVVWARRVRRRSSVGVWGWSQSCWRFVYTTGSARGVGNTPCAGTTRSA